MKIVHTKQNIFDIRKNQDAVCVTTNGIVKQNKKAVMGRGIALEASNLFPNLAKDLGACLMHSGNHTYLFEYENIPVITFPTKHDWRNPSDINLIFQSANELVFLCDTHSIHRVYLPPVGCGNGGLNWTYVHDTLVNILDDRFIFILNQ